MGVAAVSDLNDKLPRNSAAQQVGEMPEHSRRLGAQVLFLGVISTAYPRMLYHACANRRLVPDWNPVRYHADHALGGRAYLVCVTISPILAKVRDSRANSAASLVTRIVPVNESDPRHDSTTPLPRSVATVEDY